jgi:hypothetical protein
MHKAFAYILLAILSFPVGAQPFWQGPVIDEVQVKAPFYSQNTLAWCWVASAKMVVEALGETAPNQCVMLEQVYGYPCCSQPWACNRPGYIAEIANLINKFGYSMSTLVISGNGYQIFNLLRTSNAPLVAWVDKSHFVVITGMKIVPSQYGPWEGIVRVHDPIRGRFDQDWSFFSQRLGAILYINN